MKIFYSASAQGFFNSTLHSTIPPDAVEIPKKKYDALLKGQSEGKIIQTDDSGVPVLSNIPKDGG